MQKAFRFIAYITVIFLIISAQTTCVSSPISESKSSLPYYTGSGGRGLRIAVLELTEHGLAESEKWMLPLIQGSITSDFNRFSFELS